MLNTTLQGVVPLEIRKVPIPHREWAQGYGRECGAPQEQLHQKQNTEALLNLSLRSDVLCSNTYLAGEMWKVY